MKLESFRIKNFKSIINTGWIKISLANENMIILAGQNESGKSAILEALDFFENGAGDTFEENLKRLGTSPMVECKYLFTDDELAEIESLYGTEVKEELRESGITYVRGDEDKDDYEALKYYRNDRLVEIFTKNTENNANENTDVDQENDEDNDSSNNLANCHKHIGKLRPRFIFYSSFDAGVLPSKISITKLEENQAVKDFEKVFNIDFKTALEDKNDANRNRIVSDVNKKASEDLNRYWRQKISGDKARYMYEIELHPQFNPPAPNTVESYIQFFVKQDDGYNLPLHFGQKSKGFQWFSGFNLRLRAHNATKDNLKNFILLIDEPGQWLHEEAQKDVKNILNELASNGVQILFSTHYPQLLKTGDGLDFAKIRLVINSRENGTSIDNIAQATSKGGYKDALSPIRTAMGMVSMDASMLSLSNNVVVEGITEKFYIDGFIKLSGASRKRPNIIPASGVTQIPNIFSILIGWSVSNIMAFVDDDNSGKTVFNKLKKSFFENSEEKAKEAILYIDGCPGIETIFTEDDFKKFAKDYVKEWNDDENNSKNANNNKEVISRAFLEKVNSGELKLDDFEEKTKSNIRKLIDFITR